MHDLDWKERYAIGHPLIDNEHKHLFEIAMKAFKPVAPELRKEKIKDAIVELKEYMKIHFKHEESFMRVIEYPNTNQHINIHQIIIDNMKVMLNKLPNSNIKEFEKDLAYFIESSLISHIIDEDRKIQKWYENKKGQRYIIHWQNEYLVGHKEIDDEHQFLFHISNEAFVLSEKDNSSKEKIKEIVMKLSLYIKQHFEHEENYMREIKYPHLMHHHEMHENIINEMNSFLKKIINMDTVAFEFELAIFIEKWLVQHIIYEDRKIKEFIKGEDIKIINIEGL
ncbi:bacteriohemerythrin [Sulfurimonas sp.]|nr:bacteriohemerythrin [Sulfurimonas sp.]